MRVGFYYHIPISCNKDQLRIPSYLGVFVDALAKQVNHLYLVMHEASGNEVVEADYCLKQRNVTWINLGLKTPAWHRIIFHKKILKSQLSKIKNCDLFLVRSPSPLASFFDQYLHGTKVCFMIVGDYTEGLKNINGGVRQFFVRGLLYYINWVFERKIKHSDIIVNSPFLYKKYEFLAKSIKIIKTTTISDSDFFYRADTCVKPTIEILYTGRLDLAKGLFELIEAISYLRMEGFNVTCNIVGSEVPSSSHVVKDALIDRATKLKIDNFIVFHGWKSIGDDLNYMYRMADIYVIPSYHEGFPRTIWEALANSLPVIATNVGAIPFFLKNDESAIIIKPKDSRAIKNAIARVIQDEAFRKKLIGNGFFLAKDVTQEKQMIVLINHLKEIFLN